MNAWEIILPIAIGALIGYCTNFIAIKMLFLPRRVWRIGKWRVPFTPGVIPKNKSRLASAVGNAVSEKLLTESDVINSLRSGKMKDAAVEKITSYVMQDGFSVKEALLDLTQGADAGQFADKVSGVLAVKILDGIGKGNLHSVISDIAEESFGSLVSNPLVSMLLGGNALDSICGKIEGAITDYIERHGQEKLTQMVRGELDCMLSKSLKSNLEDFDCNEDSVRRLISGLFDKFAQTNIPDMIGTLDIKGIVEAKINEMNVKELEELVMSVMKNELRAIVNLGAVIGAVIGIINIFI